MLLGYNTSGLQNHRLDEGLRLLADHGYRAVALTPDVGHLDPFRCTAREVDAVAALLSELRLLPVIETGARFLLDPGHKHEPTLMTRDAAGVTRRVEFYRRVAAIGRDLGARVVSFWAGTDRDPGPDSGDRLLAGVARAVEGIAAAGMQPALEPEPGMAVETVADFERLCAQLGGRDGARSGGGAPLGGASAAAPLALSLDLGHLYAVWEGEPAEVIRRVAPQVAQVHLEDMRRGVHEHLEPGAGDVDFQAVVGALAAGGYAGPVCWELSRSSHRAPTAVAACARLWHQLGA